MTNINVCGYAVEFSDLSELVVCCDSSPWTAFEILKIAKIRFSGCRWGFGASQDELGIWGRIEMVDPSRVQGELSQWP